MQDSIKNHESPFSVSKGLEQIKSSLDSSDICIDDLRKMRGSK